MFLPPLKYMDIKKRQNLQLENTKKARNLYKKYSFRVVFFVSFH